MSPSAVPTTWRKPPFIQRTWLRRGLWLGAIIYLVLAVGTLDINWARVAEGLGRGWSFVQAFIRPDFGSRYGDIVQGFQESGGYQARTYGSNLWFEPGTCFPVS